MTTKGREPARKAQPDAASPVPPEAKFDPPHHRVRLLSRPRLVERSDEVMQSTLTVVRTPAGYGKTTLLGQWRENLTRAGCKAIWISLDRDERDPAAFAATIIRAAAHQRLCDSALVQIAQATAPAMSPEQVLRPLLSSLAAVDAPVVIFLDDYHLAEAPDVDALVGELLRRVPANLHLVMATRSKPSLPLSGLRVTGRLHELSADDLRFSDLEVSAFMGDGLGSQDVALLASRTEGWPVALQIAQLWIGERDDAQAFIAGFSGSTEEMAGYMVDQVMRQLPSATREVLLRTSILRRINGDVANAICLRDDGWQVLDELERLNALIFPLDCAKSWYRHHHLFAEFLRDQLSRLGEAEIKLLHRRASAWFVSRGDTPEAVEHARAAGDIQLALTILDEADLFYRMVRDGVDSYRKFKVLFTPQALAAYPRVAVAQVLLWMKDGELDEARILLDNIAARLEAGDYDAPRFLREKLAEELLVMESFLGNYTDSGVSTDAIGGMVALAGRSDPHDHWYRALLNNIICTMHFHRGNLINAMAAAYASLNYFSLAGLKYGHFFMSLHLGGLQLLRGDLDGASESARAAAHIAQEIFPFDRNIRALSQIFLAEIDYEENRIDGAAEVISDALRQAEEADGWIEIYLSGYRTAIGLAFARQGREGIEPVLQMGRRFARRRGLPRLTWFLLVREIHCLTVCGAVAEARQLMEECTATLALLRERFDDAQTWRESEEHAATLAQLLTAEGRPEEALILLKRLAAQYEASDHLWRLTQTRLLLAIAHRAVGQIDDAARELRLAMHLSRPGRLLRPFLDGGPAVEDLLKAVLSHVGLVAFSAGALDWATEILAAFGALKADPQRSLVSQLLTQRERDVLVSLKLGRSNKSIARELEITDNAVKFHLKNVYRKLGVNDRRLVLLAAEKRGLAL